MSLQMQGEDSTRLKNHGPRQAIDLALDSKWEEAVALNRTIVTAFPSDVDSWNRLGKALLELGRIREARESYQKSLDLDPVNKIARRNVERLSTLKDDDEPRRSDVVAKVAQDLFIEEMGKSGSTVLQDVAPEMLARTVAGAEVYLKVLDNQLRVENAQGELVGSVEPKLGLRLLRLMQGGNRYAAAVKSVSDAHAELIIKETFRDPSQTRISFPAIAEGARAYTRESLLRYENDDDDDDSDEDHDGEDWESEADREEPGTVSLSSLKESLDSGDDEDEEA